MQDDGAVTVCYQCKRKVRQARSYLSGDLRVYKLGETCKRRKGIGHYARDCPTPERRRVETVEGTSGQPHWGLKLSMRLTVLLSNLS